MKYKLIEIIVCIMLIMSTFSIVMLNDLSVSAEGGGSGENEGIGLDFQYIWNISDNLSKIIYDFPSNLIPKGRAFGSWGEQYAAYNIIQDEMIIINLYNPGLNPPFLQKIENKTSYFNKVLPSVNLTEDIEIKSFGITLYNESNTTLTEFHIRPTWNWRVLLVPFEYLWPNTEEITEEIESKLKIDMDLPYWHNMILNQSWMTINVSYQNLSFRPRPTNLSWFFDLLFDELTNITNNESIVDYPSFANYFHPVFQEKHGFTLGEINQSNPGSNLSWFNSQWEQRDNNDFLYIGEDPAFNPNASKTYPCLKEFFEKVKDKTNHPILSSIAGAILKLWEQMEMWLWNITMPHCKGLVYYDATEDVYNMVYGSFRPLPTLYINGSIGNTIIDNIDDYNISFWIDQAWKNDVESYNVIGQINGTNPNETVVIDCLYDGWWNQASADSAAGMGIVLSIAKYMKDHNITPKCNIKFIGFSGEEHGLRGACYYEANHPNETITYVIDLNQLGIKQTNPRLDFNILHNNDAINSTLNAISNETQYINRTGNTSDFRIINTNISTVASDYLPFYKNDDRDTTFLCFIEETLGEKNGSWVLHHRTGQNHAEGDSMENIDWNDVNITAELIWNVTKYFIVNPDCWFQTYNSTNIDSPDDSDTLKDSIKATFTMKSILPNDRVMIKSYLKDETSSIIVQQTNNYTINNTGRLENITLTLPEDEPAGNYSIFLELYNSTGRIDEMVDTGSKNDSSPTLLYAYLYPFGHLPEISNTSTSPSIVGFGQNVTLQTTVTDYNGIDYVKVNVTKPPTVGTLQSYTMTNTTGDNFEYVFNDTWLVGQYNYTIFAVDNYGASNISDVFSFNVSGQANISVCTIKDSYNDNEKINLTDPPIPQIGYELLDDNKVLRIWNRYDSYYFNTSNGIQLTNHYDEFWSHNVLMLGYYNNDVWNLIYRSDSLSGFNKNIESDDKTYVNATLWKNLSYSGYDFQLAIRYHLGVDDNELTVIPYIKNIDDENIPYNLGFAWEINDIQIDMTPEGDYIKINGTSYYLNTSLDMTYYNLNNSCFYIREDFAGNLSESLYLRWDKELNDIVRVESREGQYNTPVTLGIKIGTLGVGQEKYTSLFWHDACEATYYFDSYDDMPMGEAWASNPGYIVDGNINNYASTSLDGDVELCDGNTCPESDPGTISKVELRCNGYRSGSGEPVYYDIILRPVFSKGDGDNHIFEASTSAGWSDWFDITYDTNAPETWFWQDIIGLDCDVESDISSGVTLYCSKVEVRVTYTVESAPMISNLFPSDGSTGIIIQPVLNITVNDPEGYSMNISWLSNSSGSWTVFGTNISCVNGTYHQPLVNASVNG